MYYPPPELTTSGTELLGSEAGMVFTALAAVLGLGVLLGIVYLADAESSGTLGRLLGRRRAGLEGGVSLGEIGPGQGARPSDQVEHRHVAEGRHPHGRPASWVVVAVVTAAFVVGGFAIVGHTWWLFWTCAGIILLSIPAGWMAGMMKDTVLWGATPAATEPDGGGEAVPAHRQTAPTQGQSAPDAPGGS